MFLVATLALAFTSEDVVVYEGGNGPGKGKHIVFLAGDEEYRSEEGLPQLAHILAQRHGFRCTVVFSLNSKGEIDPNTQDNQPGVEALDTADLCVMQLRFRRWPDAQMKHFVDYYLAGKPIVALRTSTHAFDFKEGTYAKYGWASKEWPGGFGKQVLGETWVSHWGNHGSQATHGVVEGGAKPSPIMTGVSHLFGTTDVYEAAPPVDSNILVRGQVLSGMNEGDPPAAGQKKTAGGVSQGLNEPMMPIVWTRRLPNDAGTTNQIFTTTMGAATDLLDPGFRRLMVNAVFWCTGLEPQIKNDLDVRFVGEYAPSKFGFDGFHKGVKPKDLVLKSNG